MMLQEPHIRNNEVFSNGLHIRPRSGSVRNPLTNTHLTPLYRTRSLQRLSEEKKAKKVRFYRNGDQFHQGLVYAISPSKFRNFDALLAELTHGLADKANLPQGARVVFTLNGARKIDSLHELEQGESYVVASSDVFKKIDYTRNTNPNWCTNVRTTSSISLRLRKQERNDDLRSCVSHETLFSNAEKEKRDFIVPKLITVIRSGVKPRRAVRMLLNKKTCHSMEQVFNDITKAIKLDTGAVRKIFSLQGKQVMCLQDFFSADNTFIAYGHEKLLQEDFKIDPEESKFVRPYQSSGPRTPRVTMQRKGSARSAHTAPTGMWSHQQRMKRRSLRTANVQKIPIALNDSTFESSDWPSQIGERYEVGDVIGDGNFAVVRECVERSSGTKYALKIIDKSKCVGKEQMIFNEVSILRRIKHPNVIQLFQEFDLTKDIYLVMELVNGGDLFDAISSATRYTERDASGMLHNLASALAHIHKLRIVHRDIKPENLLVCEYEDGSKALKLADFGLATSVSGPLYTVCGTPTYVAPEIIAQTGYGLKVDVWAAGVIAYVLLCGFPPFKAPSQEELFDAILAGDFSFQPEHWDHISESAQDLITRCLEMDEKLRMSSNEMLHHPWVAEDTALDRDMKRSVSNKLSRFQEREVVSPGKNRKRRVNVGARVLALTSLDKNDQLYSTARLDCRTKLKTGDNTDDDIIVSHECVSEDGDLDVRNDSNGEDSDF